MQPLWDCHSVGGFWPQEFIPLHKLDRFDSEALSIITINVEMCFSAKLHFEIKVPFTLQLQPHLLQLNHNHPHRWSASHAKHTAFFRHCITAVECHCISKQTKLWYIVQVSNKGSCFDYMLCTCMLCMLYTVRPNHNILACIWVCILLILQIHFNPCKKCYQSKTMCLIDTF